MVTAKDSYYSYYFNILYNRLCDMFKFNGVPPNIDISFLNRCLFIDGLACFFKHNNELVALNTALGGEPDIYYRPKNAIIANPVIGSKNLIIDKDCVVMYNSTADKLIQNTYDTKIKSIPPIYGLLDKTADLMAECAISILIGQKNTRLTALISAPTQATKTSAEIVLKDIYEGKAFKVVSDSIVDNIKVFPIATKTDTLIQLKEMLQFFLSSFYHSIGVDSNMNYKRERLTTTEINADSEPLLINIIDMLSQRECACEKINKMFDTSISVEISGEWRECNDEPTTDTDSDGATADTVQQPDSN